MIGNGDIDIVNEIEERIHALDLENYVKILGVRDDVSALLNVMDAFIFPSKYEGLPFTLIETQCNGLRAISSDVVTPQVKISEGVRFLSLLSPDEEWANTIISEAKKGRIDNATNLVVEAGYDIDVEAEKLKEYYITQIQRWKD